MRRSAAGQRSCCRPDTGSEWSSPHQGLNKATWGLSQPTREAAGRLVGPYQPCPGEGVFGAIPVARPWSRKMVWVQAIKSAAVIASCSQTALMANSRDGKRLIPVCLTV